MQLLDLITIFIFALGIVIMGLSFSGKGRNMKSFFAAGGAVPWLMSGLSLFLWDFLRRNFRGMGIYCLFTRMDRYFDSMDNGDSRICCWFLHCSTMA